MAFFHSILVFVIADSIIKLPISVMRAKSSAFDTAWANLVYVFLFSAILAFIFVPCLSGLLLWQQIILIVIVGIWAYFAQGISANNLMKRSRVDWPLHEEEYVAGKNRMFSGTFFLVFVPAFYFLIFRNLVYESSFIFVVVHFFSTRIWLSIIAFIVGLILFLSSIPGIGHIFGLAYVLILSIFKRGTED